jgi:ABC-type nitrate/sulfonate/bicarbonate transport system permease component
VAVGWGVAVLLGVAAALVLGRSSSVVARAVPVAAAVSLVLFHLGTVVEVAAIAAGAVGLVLSYAAEGVRSVDPVTMDVASVYRVPWYVRVCVVVLPAAAPRICAGARAGLAVAFGLMAVAEIGRGGGVPDRWAWLALVAVVWGAATWLIGVAERRAERWREG